MKNKWQKRGEELGKTMGKNSNNTEGKEISQSEALVRVRVRVKVRVRVRVSDGAKR